MSEEEAPQCSAKTRGQEHTVTPRFDGGTLTHSLPHDVTIKIDFRY